MIAITLPGISARQHRGCYREAEEDQTCQDNGARYQKRGCEKPGDKQKKHDDEDTCGNQASDNDQYGQA
jgi:hypothetical protein